MKLLKILAWSLVILLALLFISSGYPKVLPNESMINRFSNWGYSKGFAQLIGVLESLMGILLLFPRTVLFASTVLLIIMLGAIYTHLSTGIGDPWFAAIVAVLLAILMFLRIKLKKKDPIGNQPRGL